MNFICLQVASILTVAFGDPLYYLQYPKRDAEPKCPLNDAHYRGLGNWSAFRDTTNPYPYFPHYPVSLLSAMAYNAEMDVVLHQCDPPTKINTEDPLWTRSLCPWYWKENYDANRVPAVLLEAHCKCDKSTVTLGDVRAVYECEKVFYKVRVLKLDENCGYYSTYEEVSIACATIVSAWKVAHKGPLVNVHDTLPVSNV